MNAKENKLIATARCHPKDKVDNRGVAEGEDGYFNGTTGLPVGIHLGLHRFFSDKGLKKRLQIQGSAPFSNQHVTDMGSSIKAQQCCSTMGPFTKTIRSIVFKTNLNIILTIARNMRGARVFTVGVKKMTLKSAIFVATTIF
jgi:hypothetical protein